MNIKNELEKLDCGAFWTDTINYYLGKVGYELDTVQEYIRITKKMLEENRIDELRIFLFKYSNFSAVVLQSDSFYTIKVCNDYIKKAIDNCKKAELAQESEQQD